jgi:transcriptional regulator with XRE-family HTH domain
MSTSEVNARIKAVREAKKLSQTEFGKALSVTRDAINNYDHDRAKPSQLFLDNLCRVYNVNPIWLETGGGEMFREKTTYETLAEFFGDVLNDEPESFRIAFLSSLAELDDDGWAMLAEECRIKAEIYNKRTKDSE